MEPVEPRKTNGIAEELKLEGSGTFAALARESLAIGGWVAMWRPMEIYSYDWWPLRPRGRMLKKLSRMTVEVLSLVVYISFFLISDIDSPRGGVIRVKAQNLQSLVESVRAP